MREAFITTLEAIARKDKKIFLLNGDLGFSVLENFNRSFPERAINAGVAEANMVGMAAGLALEGKTVFAYTIVPFATMRAFEQVRNDVAMQQANVKIVGVGAGFTYGQLGPTHHSIEDVALMLALPNMKVFTPGDPVEAAFVTKSAAEFMGPAYIRIGKKGDTIVHESAKGFKVGRALTVRNGNDAAIFVSGSLLPSAIAVSDALIKLGIHVRVISFHTLKPLDEEIILRAAKETGNIYTLEEHNIVGGFGSLVASLLMDRRVSVKHFYRFGIHDTFTYVSGSQEYLRRKHGLDVEQILSVIRKSRRRKKA